MLRWLGTALLFALVGLCFAPSLIPPFLDRIYYRGPLSDHFDGARFRNPDGEDTFRVPGGRSRGGFLARWLLGSDDRPPWPERVRVAPSRPAARIDGERMVVTWIGHAAFLIQTNGLNILTDPIWSEVAGPFGIGPRRVAAPGIRFQDLPKIDLVFVSHNHYDHMDLPTLKRLWDRDKPLIVTSLGNDSVMRQAGISARALDWNKRLYYAEGEWVDLPPVVECAAPPAFCGFIGVTATRSHHWGSRWFTDRNRALWSSFTVRLRGGNLFFTGDTGFGDGKWPAEARALGPIRLALIPIGAFRFAPGEMGAGSHVGPYDAVRVFQRLGAARAIGMHWGTFRLSYEAYRTPPLMLAALMRCAGYPAPGPFHIARIGAPTEIAAYASPPARPEISRTCLDSRQARGLP